MELLARGCGRTCCRGKEGCVREVRRLLDQLDQTWRVSRHTDDLQLVCLDVQLGHIGMVRQSLRECLKGQYGCGRRAPVTFEGLLLRRGARCCVEERCAMLRDPLCELLLLRLERIERQLGACHRNASRNDHDHEGCGQQAAGPLQPGFGAEAVLEDADMRAWYRRLRRGRDREGPRADGHERLQVGGDQRPRGRRHCHHDAVLPDLARLRPAEGGIAGAPGRQPIDLGADDALEKLGRALGQLEWSEQETIRLQHQLQPASPQRRRQGRRECGVELAIHDSKLVSAGPRRSSPACDLDIEPTAIALDQAHAARGIEPSNDREQRARDDVDPSHEYICESAKVHRWNPVRNPRVVGSMSACQDKTRKGSLASPGRMTASEATCRPLSKLMRVVTRVAGLPSAVTNGWPPSCAVADARRPVGPSGVIPGMAASTSGAASRVLIWSCPLKMVTCGSTRSTSSGGSPNTSHSSPTWSKGAPRER